MRRWLAARPHRCRAGRTRPWAVLLCPLLRSGTDPCRKTCSQKQDKVLRNAALKCQVGLRQVYQMMHWNALDIIRVLWEEQLPKNANPISSSTNTSSLAGSGLGLGLLTFAASLPVYVPGRGLPGPSSKPGLDSLLGWRRQRCLTAFVVRSNAVFFISSCRSGLEASVAQSTCISESPICCVFPQKSWQSRTWTGVLCCLVPTARKIVR